MEPIEFWVFGGEGVEGREENGFSNYFLFKKDKTFHIGHFQWYLLFLLLLCHIPVISHHLFIA